MSSIFTEIRRRNAFNLGAACAEMGRLRRNVNVGDVRNWPFVSVKEVLNVAVLNVSLAPESGRYGIWS